MSKRQGCEDRNDTPLSVLSALARLELDPWQEAAELAQLPRESAIQRLALSIAALAGGPPPHLEHGIIAARLIALLPRHRDSETPAGQTVEDASDIRKFRAVCMLPLLSLDSTLKPHSPRGGFFWSLKRRALFSCPSGLNCSDSVLRPNQHCMRGDGESTWNSSSAAKT